MRIFITGGSGFLGQHVVRRLLKEGHTIGALARSEAAAKIVESMGATAIIGDLNQVSSFASALGGYEAVIHCAAPVEFWGPWELYQEGIIDATLSLARECNRQGLQKFIHLSSEAVLQGTKPLLDISEDFPYPQEPNSYYGQAKKILEERLMELPGSIKIVILRPSFIWGPGCPAFVEISEKVRSKQFVWVDQGRVPFEAVHVENVVEAIRLSLNPSLNFARDKSIFFVTDGVPSTVREFFSSLFDSLKLVQPTTSFPGLLLSPLISVMERTWRFLGIQKKPPLTRFDLAFVSMPRRYKLDRIKSELGYQPILSRAEGFKGLGISHRLS